MINSSQSMLRSWKNLTSCADARNCSTINSVISGSCPEIVGFPYPWYRGDCLISACFVRDFRSVNPGQSHGSSWRQHILYHWIPVPKMTPTKIHPSRSQKHPEATQIPTICFKDECWNPVLSSQAAHSCQSHVPGAAGFCSQTQWEPAAVGKRKGKGRFDFYTIHINKRSKPSIN